MIGIPGRLDGIVQGLRESPAESPAVVRDLRAVGDRVIQRQYRIVRVATALRVEKLQRHDLGIPVDAGDADAVVADGGDGSRHVRSVIVVVERITVVVGEVVSVDIVDEAIAVVVDSVVGNFIRIDPHVCREIDVTIIDSRVDHRHDGLAAADRRIPGFRRIDVGVDRAVGLPLIVQTPLFVKTRIVGGGADLNLIDGFGVQNRIETAQLLDGRFHRQWRGQRESA